ncbi:ATP-grasp domain-containing protein [Chengkuizengella axinellae]|uniref:ATP-grasp domain-containing protein n=1 Tax=Chengkuizengella axinellae TaxID=3064388 RepID=A0ABT9IZR1_9BACL|nr:ATP-grasp domain-containing protein [Chengkuizengella sp. 2205SS18-9]MDP5274864.1 ATP-grasp domain-containing protein [Chengkuizengella sp. 2205SS18-9]
MSKHIVIVEATTSGSGLEVVKSACETGLYVSFVSKDPQRYMKGEEESSILKKVENLITADSNSVSALKVTIKQLNELHTVDGIICLTDGHIETVSRVARDLSLNFMNPEAVSIARNKDQTRLVCEENRIPIPKFQIVDDVETACEIAKKWGYPCIIKSSRGTGSAQVFLCRNQEELLSKFSIIHEKKELTSGLILLEEFVCGPLYSIEGITYDGKTTFLGITDRMMGALPHFVEIADSFPVQLEPNMFEKVKKVIGKLHEAIGVDYGMTHTEFILTENGPVIVEMNPRLGGGMIGPMISESYDIDIYKQIINIAIGKAPIIPDNPIAGASEYFIYSTREGVVSQIKGEELAKKYPGVQKVVITAKSGDMITSPTDFRGEIGYLWTVGSNAEMAAANCRSAAGAISVDFVVSNDIRVQEGTS